MKKEGLLKAALFGVLIGGAVIGAADLGHRLAGLPFIPFDLFDWITRVLPGRLVVFGIETMVGLIRTLRLGPTDTTAKLAEQGLALIQFLGTWAVFGLIVGIIARRRPERAPVAGAAGGAAPGRVRDARRMGPGIPGKRRPRGEPLADLPSLRRRDSSRPDDPTRIRSGPRDRERGDFEEALPPARRDGLLRGDGHGRRREPREQKKESGRPSEIEQEEIKRAAETSGPAASPPAGELEKRIPAAAGTRPELTNNLRFLQDRHQPSTAQSRRQSVAARVRRPRRAPAHPVPRRHPFTAPPDPGHHPVLHLEPDRRRSHQHELLDRASLRPSARRSRPEARRPGAVHRIGRRLL